MSIFRPVTSQSVTVDGTSAAVSNAFGGSITVLRIASTTACHYALGTSPTAVATDTLLPAGEIEYIKVVPGEKIAFIQNAAGGTAIATEMA